MKNKRSISTVATILLIILLSIVAIIVVWVVIKDNASRGEEDISITEITPNLQIQKVFIEEDTLYIIVHRNSGEGNLLGINFVISDGNNSVVVRKNTNLSQLENETFIFSISNELSILEEIKTITIAPIYETSYGKSTTGNVSDSFYTTDNEGEYIPTNCTINCTNKNCGSDGCGGICGTCSGSDYCMGGICKTSGGHSDLSESFSWDNYWATRFPSELAATVISDSQINLSWTNNGIADYDGVGIERSTDAINYSGINNVTLGVSSYSDTELTAGTIYYYHIRAYAGLKYSNYSNIDAAYTTKIIVDADGNVYTKVVIEAQTWLLQNLKTTKYNDDSAIPTGLNNTAWAAENGTAEHDGAFAQVNNDSANKADYGLLYNWFAVNNSKGIAPAGFRVATDADYDTLIEYLDGASNAGKHMKETGTTHWNSLNPLSISDNSSGFTAVGAGYRATDGTYSLFKDYALLWSASVVDADNAYDAQIDRTVISVQQVSQPKTLGMSVRCIENRQRFQDNFLGNIIPSMNAIGEPTVLISDDGEQIDLWFTGTVGGVSNIYYSYSSDGATFAVPVKTDVTDDYMRSGIMKEGSNYYLFANGKIGGALDQTIHLFTSTDKIHFTDQGEMIGIGTHNVWDHMALGNTFVWKENNTYYLFYDGLKEGVGEYWKTGLATASTITGPWTKYASNPIFGSDSRDIEGAEIFRVNNEIIKHNGLYYAYMAYGDGGHTGGFYYVERLHSSDLHTWVSDGLVTDFFHKVGGYLSYADAAYCQYKGKSYVFMNPSNQVDAAYLDMGIDNRLLIAMLALTP